MQCVQRKRLHFVVVNVVALHEFWFALYNFVHDYRRLEGQPTCPFAHSQQYHNDAAVLSAPQHIRVGHMRETRLVREVVEEFFDDKENTEHAEYKGNGHVHHDVLTKAFVHTFRHFSETVVQLKQFAETVFGDGVC